MKRSLLIVSVLLFVCSAVSADPFQINFSYSTSGGWPYASYQITPDAGAPAWMTGFDTFCVEHDVTVDSGKYWATIDDEVLGGGSVGTLLSDDAKKIYAAYLNGYLNGYTENQVQYAIWKERGYSVSAVDLSSVIANSDSIVNWEHVKVLNLWNSANDNGICSGDVQSQLVMTPVPVPSAIMLGLLGLGVANRRLKKHV